MCRPRTVIPEDRPSRRPHAMAVKIHTPRPDSLESGMSAGGTLAGPNDVAAAEQQATAAAAAAAAGEPSAPRADGAGAAAEDTPPEAPAPPAGSPSDSGPSQSAQPGKQTGFEESEDDPA